MNGKERIANTSKKWLEDSLLNLMKLNSYEDITVTDISNNADLSRRTFYRFFKNKNELLEYYFSKIVKEYIKILNERIEYFSYIDNKEITLQKLIDIFFEFWWNHRNDMRILIKQGLFTNLFLNNADSFSEIYKKFKMPWHINDNVDLKYVIDFFIGGYMNIISHWLISDNPENPKEISKIIYDSIKKM